MFIRLILPIIFLVLNFPSIGQTLEKKNIQIFERNIKYPLEKLEKKESSIALLEYSKKGKNSRDTFLIINEVDSVFKQAISEALKIILAKGVFNHVKSKSLIPIYFSYFENSTPENKSIISFSNLGSLLFKLSEKKGDCLYDPIIITGYDPNKRTQ